MIDYGDVVKVVPDETIVVSPHVRFYDGMTGVVKTKCLSDAYKDTYEYYIEFDTKLGKEYRTICGKHLKLIVPFLGDGSDYKEWKIPKNIPKRRTKPSIDENELSAEYAFRMYCRLDESLERNDTFAIHALIPEYNKLFELLTDENRNELHRLIMSRANTLLKMC